MRYKKKSIKPAYPLECQEQQALADYLRAIGLLFTCSLAGVNLPMPTAMKLKRMGYSSGTPDVMIFEPNKTYKGLFIELKRVKGGTLSPEQEEWINELNKRGYFACRCNGAEVAIEVVNRYRGNNL